MFEIDARHQPYEVTDLDAGTLFGLVAEDRVRDLKAVRRKLRLAYQCIVLHPPTHPDESACWSDAALPSLLTLDDLIGGEGSPPIKAFAAEEFAAAANLSRHAALCLLADAGDLVHRFPRLWAKVESLDVEGWKARRVAEIARHLSYEAARWFDDDVAATGLYGWRSLELALARATAKFHPDLVRDRKGPKNKKDWRVSLQHDQGLDGTASGTAEMNIVGDSLDLARFNELLGIEAARLQAEGDQDTLDQRKAKAIGSLVTGTGLFGPDPDTGHSGNAGRHPGNGAGAGAGKGPGQGAEQGAGEGAAGRSQPTSASPVASRRRGLRVMVHVSLTELLGLAEFPFIPRRPDGHHHHETDHSGDDRTPVLADAGTLGPILVEQLRDWLVRHGSIATVTPVIDLNCTDSVDRHDPPEWMDTAVRLRDRTCVFPGCTRDSFDADLDHIEPYDHGDHSDHAPPGQTHPANLAPLCRRHHLLKTYGRWRYRRTDDGNYLWTNRHGRSWITTPHGSIPIGPLDPADPLNTS